MQHLVMIHFKCFLLLVFLLSPFADLNNELSKKAVVESNNLFSEETPIQVQITGDLKSLFSDRGDNPQYYKMLLKELSAETPQVFEFQAKTRGHFRLKLGNCTYPPIELNFSESTIPQHSVFSGQDKLKLVVPCKDPEDVVKEYLAYKIYNLLTDFSFKVRLVELQFNDPNRKKPYKMVVGFILEDQYKMAARLGGEIFKRDGLKGDKMSKSDYLLMTVFEFLIGNTDWSTEYRHNIKLLRIPDYDLPVAVPYDFDHAGLVSAPYALPPPTLGLNSVQERRYRGYCLEDSEELDASLDLFKEKKVEILDLIKEEALLSKNSQKELTGYIESFYQLLDKPKAKKAAFRYPCLPNSSSNVVIKGLN